MPRAADALRGNRGRARARCAPPRARFRVVALLLAVALALTACTSAETPPEASPPEGPTEAAPVRPDLSDELPEATEERDEPAPEPPASPEPAEEPPLPEGRAELVTRTQRLVEDAVRAAEDAQLAVLVTDEHGREIAAYRADEAVIPASTLKVVTAAALLMTLGPDATFTTRIETTAPISGDGRVRGDLALVGGGDPVLATDEYERWIYPARPRTRLASLADALVAQGVTHVDGDVVGTAPGFTGPTRAEGWPDRYFNSFDARYASGLTVDGGLRTILTYPEPEEPDDADGGDEEGNDSASEDPGDDGDDPASDDPDEEGDDPAGPADGDEDGSEPGATLDPEEELGPPDVTVDHVLDPAAHAAAELVRLLEERDVRVLGEGRSGELEERRVGRLATVESPPLDELLRFAVQRSDNHLTDGLFQSIGRIRTGEGSWERGERALRQVLDRFDIDHSQAVFADGSGLSREDRVTARLLVDLDRQMNSGRHAETWASLMAVMGESGTLRQRLAGTVAAGRFLGKTGTLRDVTALSGAVIGEGDQRYHLAVIANDANGPGRWVTRELMDELILQLSAEVAGCDVTPGERDEDATSIPRSTISC